MVPGPLPLEAISIHPHGLPLLPFPVPYSLLIAATIVESSEAREGVVSLSSVTPLRRYTDLLYFQNSFPGRRMLMLPDPVRFPPFPVVTGTLFSSTYFQNKTCWEGILGYSNLSSTLPRSGYCYFCLIGHVSTS